MQYLQNQLASFGLPVALTLTCIISFMHTIALFTVPGAILD